MLDSPLVSRIFSIKVTAEKLFNWLVTVKDAGAASNESANRALVHRQDCINGL